MKYIYYHIYKFYLRWGDRTPDILATGVITIVECCNIMSILSLFTFYGNYTFKISEWMIVSIAGLYILNLFYFRRISTDERKKWDVEDPTKRDTKGALIILYIVISVIFPFYLATKIYNQSQVGI